MIRRILLCCALLLNLEMATADETPVVAVAANFSPVLEEILRHYTALTGQEVRISAGSSGTLVRQIEQGAPFQLFLSADEHFVEYLYNRGLAQDTGRIYAIGVLVLYLPHASKLNVMADHETMLGQMYSDRNIRIAIANPDLAPYGLAAREVLQRFGGWSELSDRLILGENVGQTAQFALTGSVDAAFLPYSLAINHDMQSAGHFQLLPADWYTPIRQRMVLLKNAGAAAQELYEYFSSDTVRQIIVRHGYTIPADE